MVVKKNKDVLPRIKTLIPEEIIPKKTSLIIDDEADLASINTNKPSEEPTKIHKSICKIIKVFERCFYIGYTATPFAPILQDDENKNNPLYPEFIIDIPAPKGYVGIEEIFGDTPFLIGKDRTKLSELIVVHINDCEAFVPSKHKSSPKKQEHEFNGSIPQSLKRAIKCFIITCTIKKIRQTDKRELSMLINLSKFVEWHDYIKKHVDNYMNELKSRIKIKQNDSTIFEEFRNILEVDKDEYKSYKTIEIKSNIPIPSWEDIKEKLPDLINEIKVQVLNGKYKEKLPDNKSKESGTPVIVIGGDKISRGISLEELSISYFSRSSKTYDTSTQMARWCGFLSDVTLCRLFITKVVERTFVQIAETIKDFRSQIKKWKKSGKTTKEYPWRCLEQGEDLILGIKNKDPEAVALQDNTIISDKKGQYTKRCRIKGIDDRYSLLSLLKNNDAQKANWNKLECLIPNLGDPIKEDETFVYIWEGISYEHVYKFLSEFNCPETEHSKIQNITNRIQKNFNGRDWRVVLKSRSRKSKTKLHEFSEKVKIRFLVRKEDDKSNKDLYKINEAALSTDSDERFLNNRQTPLLLIYPLIREKHSKKDQFISFIIILPNNKDSDLIYRTKIKHLRSENTDI